MFILAWACIYSPAFLEPWDFGHMVAGGVPEKSHYSCTSIQFSRRSLIEIKNGNHVAFVHVALIFELCS